MGMVMGSPCTMSEYWDAVLGPRMTARDLIDMFSIENLADARAALEELEQRALGRRIVRQNAATLADLRRRAAAEVVRYLMRAV
jgi:hypothetical protein